MPNREIQIRIRDKKGKWIRGLRITGTMQPCCKFLAVTPAVCEIGEKNLVSDSKYVITHIKTGCALFPYSLSKEQALKAVRAIKGLDWSFETLKPDPAIGRECAKLIAISIKGWYGSVN